jgi:hypothetical protein
LKKAPPGTPGGAFLSPGGSNGPIVIAEDPSDDAVLACAATVRVDYILSGDQHLLDLGAFRGIPILSPGQYSDLPGDGRVPPHGRDAG